jgi:ABC-type multidrug transport system fused ATPase/permease subunit
MLQQITIGLIGMIVGVCMVVFARWIVENIGSSATAERYFGRGGTFTALRFFGIIFIFLFLLYMTGFLGKMITSIGSAVFGG